MNTSNKQNLPNNFGLVYEYVYRSALPNSKNIIYLRKTLGLNTVIDLSDRNRDLVKNTCEKLGINYYKFPMIDTEINESLIKEVITLINNLCNKPILIHCFHGRHRTGLIVSMLYKYRGVSVNENLKQLFKFKFGDPLKHIEYFNWILNQIC
jgi:tyrosine-protein phosphatase SIW14